LTGISEVEAFISREKSAKSSFIENKLLAPRIKMRIEKNNAAIKVRAIRPMSLPL
jgi:hypothetical protein